MADTQQSQDQPDEKLQQFFKVQKFWCPECREWHEASVLGGPIGVSHEVKETQ